MKRNAFVLSLLVVMLVPLAVLTSGCSSCAGDDASQQQQQPSTNVQAPKNSSPRRIHMPVGMVHGDGAAAPSASAPPSAPADGGS